MGDWFEKISVYDGGRNLHNRFVLLGTGVQSVLMVMGNIWLTSVTHDDRMKANVDAGRDLAVYKGGNI